MTAKENSEEKTREIKFNHTNRNSHKQRTRERNQKQIRTKDAQRKETNIDRRGESER